MSKVLSLASALVLMNIQGCTETITKFGSWSNLWWSQQHLALRLLRNSPTVQNSGQNVHSKGQKGWGARCPGPTPGHIFLMTSSNTSGSQGNYVAWKKPISGDFTGAPVVKNLLALHGDTGLILGSGTQISHATEQQAHTVQLESPHTAMKDLMCYN